MGNAEFTAHVNYAASLICNQQKQDADHGDSVEDALENLMKAEAEYYLKDYAGDTEKVMREYCAV